MSQRLNLVVTIILYLFLLGVMGGCLDPDHSTQGPAYNHNPNGFLEYNQSSPLPDEVIDKQQRESGLEETGEPERSKASFQQEESHRLRLMVVGDIMMHMPQIEAGYSKEGYNFFPFFEEVAPLFEEADLVMGNLETTLGGPERGYSGYPLFSAPDELAVALKQAGFDVITTANNHSLDSGEKGLLRTIDQLEQAGLMRTGTFRSQTERDNILIITKNNVSLAVLAYTYGTNGIPVPEGKDYLVNLLDEALMKRDIMLAKEKADFVSVSIHFGSEYQIYPNEEQKEWVEKLFEWGADLVFGSHPHVLQPFELRELTREGKREEGLVIYSLGNFISNQREIPRDIGGILDVTLTKTGSERSMISSVNFIPTYVHRYQQNDRRSYQVIPMERLLELRAYPALNDEDYQVLGERYQKILEHVVPVMAEEEGFEPPQRHSTP